MNNQPLNLNYVLIAGLPRSGSTLLQAVLNKSTDTFTLPESHFFEESSKISDGYMFSSQQVVQFLEVLIVKWKLNVKPLLESYRQTRLTEDIDIRSVYFELIDQFRPTGSETLTIGIEKTPGNLSAMETLLAHRNDIKVILTHRNPRDFANSMCQQLWAPDSLYKVTKMWNESMKLIDELSNRHARNVLSVAYEDMVEQPEHTFERLFDFIDIDWSTDYLQNLNADVGEFIISDEQSWKSNNIKLPVIDATRVELILNPKQRLIVHCNNLITAIRLGRLHNYKF